MSQVKSITTRSSILFVGKIADAFFMFIFNLLAAKYAGATGYGTYVYLSSLIMFLSIAIKMGMDHGLTALLPKYDDLSVKKQLVTMSVLILLGMSLLVVGIFSIGSGFVSSVLMNNASLERPLLLFLPMMFPIAFVQMSEGIFRSIGGIKHFFFSKNILMPIVLVVTFVALNRVIGYSTLYQIIAVNYFAWFINVVYIIGILIKKKAFAWPKIENKALFRRFLVVSLPLIMVGLIEFLMGRTDAYVIGYRLTEADVGVYNIVDKLAYIGNFMFITAGSMMTPVIAGYYAKKDFKGLKETYLSINKWVLVVNTVVFFGILLLGDVVLGIFGQEYMAGLDALYFLAFAQLVNAMFGPLAYLFAMMGLEKIEWRVDMILVVLNAVLDIIVAPIGGIVAISMVTVGVYLLGNILRVGLLYRHYQIQIFTIKGFKTVFLGTLVFAAMLGLKQILPISNALVVFLLLGILLVGLYGLVVYLFDLNANERQGIKRQVQNLSKRIKG